MPDSIWGEVARIDNQVAQNQKIIEAKLEELQGHLMVLDHRLNDMEKPKPAPKKRTAKKDALTPLLRHLYHRRKGTHPPPSSQDEYSHYTSPLT
jgi:septal ring factor EnvC (AmiA/AmiB activator)